MARSFGALQIQAAARRLGHLVECSRLLDLNLTDATFRASGAHARNARQVFYVVDTNVIQAFLQPHRRGRYARLFHDPDVWPATESEKKHGYEQLCETTSAQATMLAAELVISKLSSATNLYMTRFHFSELTVQVNRLNQELGEQSRKQEFREEYARRLDQHYSELKRISDLEGLELRAAAKAGMEDDLFLDRTIQTAKLSEPELRTIRDSYLGYRKCKALALDNIIEPALQANRLNERQFWKRFHPIDWELPPQSPDDVKFIGKSRHEWLKRLQAEMQRRKQEESARDGATAYSERDESSLPADAESLALLVWASRVLPPDQKKVVFVTGDSIILNAYRKWHSKSGEGFDYLVRPLAVYAPHFNLRDAGAPVSMERNLFDAMRRAIEAWTFPFTNALNRAYSYSNTEISQRSSGARARDRFCAEVEEGDLAEETLAAILPRAINAALLKSECDRLDALADQMRRIERAAIGPVFELVRERWKAATDLAAKFPRFETPESDTDGADRTSVIADWLARLLSQAMADGFEFSLPNAIDWIKHHPEPAAQSIRFRFPLRILIPYHGKSLPVQDWLTAFAKDGYQWETVKVLMDKPALVFSLASWLAFRDNTWTEAIRFADFGSRFAAKESATDQEVADIKHECNYLKALSLRVRMAFDQPHETREADVWLRDLEAGEEALRLCLENAPGPFREARAISERASLRMTYCAWAAVGELGALGTYRKTRLDLRGVFAGAVEDLTKCREALESLKASLKKGGRDQEWSLRRDTYAWVQRQAQLGPECARILYEILISKLDPIRKEAYLPVMQRVDEMLQEMRCSLDEELTETDHTILRGYWLSARDRFGERLTHKISDLRSEPGDLPLDKAMLLAIQSAARQRATQRPL